MKTRYKWRDSEWGQQYHDALDAFLQAKAQFVLEEHKILHDFRSVAQQKEALAELNRAFIEGTKPLIHAMGDALQHGQIIVILKEPKDFC